MDDHFTLMRTTQHQNTKEEEIKVQAIWQIYLPQSIPRFSIAGEVW